MPRREESMPGFITYAHGYGSFIAHSTLVRRTPYQLRLFSSAILFAIRWIDKSEDAPYVMLAYSFAEIVYVNIIVLAACNIDGESMTHISHQMDELSKTKTRGVAT
jgi:hypothetical protein